MDALTNVQTPVPAARFAPHAPLRVSGTKSRCPDGLAAHRGLLDGLITHFPVTRRVAGDESFGWQRGKGMGADRRGIRGVLGFASRHLEFGDVRDIFNRCGFALASEKARKRLPGGKPARGS